uniref:Ovule protein n=1 Tax=Syphacia muris TaxID=451379 RepID=A0A0N5ADC1_9BILA
MMASSRLDLSGTYRNVKPRQVKKVSIPVVPDKCDLSVTYNSNSSTISNSDHCSSSKSSSSGHSRCSFLASDKSPDDQNGYYRKFLHLITSMIDC